MIFVKFMLILKGLKNFELLVECKQIMYHFKARDLEIPNI